MHTHPQSFVRDSGDARGMGRIWWVCELECYCYCYGCWRWLLLQLLLLLHSTQLFISKTNSNSSTTCIHGAYRMGPVVSPSPQDCDGRAFAYRRCNLESAGWCARRRRWHRWIPFGRGHQGLCRGLVANNKCNS